MRHYIKQLSGKSRDHKRRFALLFAGGVTVAIFSLWSLVMFGPEPQVADSGSGPVELSTTDAKASPFSNVFSGIASAWYAITHLNENGR